MIYCVGRNYASHAKELGNAVPQAPIIFFKPPASIVESGVTISLPSFSQNVQFEVELAVKLDRNLLPTEVCVANDLTARDKQKEAQDTKTPWGLAKGFKQSCGLGNWVSTQDIKLDNLQLRLTHNGKLAQNGFTKDMIFPVPVIIEYLKKCFPVQPGDIILTGTPEGVGTLKPGDEILAELVGLSSGQWTFQ